MSNELPTLLTYKEAAAFLTVSEATLRRWVMLRQVPFIKIGKSVRFDPAELEAWIRAQSVPVGGRR